MAIRIRRARRFYRAIGATTRELSAHVVGRKAFEQLADEGDKAGLKRAAASRP